MKNSYILDPGSTKWGRIILLSLLLVPFSISLFWSWNEADEKLLLVVFYIYTLTLAFFVYKIWEKYYEFAKLYRKKLNPDFPLTHSEFPEYFDKNPKIFFRSNMHIYTLIWAKYEDKQLSIITKEIKKLLLIACASPAIFFVIAVVVSIILYGA